MNAIDTRRRILDAVDANFDAQLATTRDFVAIPPTRGAVQDLVFTALTDTQFYGLTTTFRACASAPVVLRCTASTNMSISTRCGNRPRPPRCLSRNGAG